MSLFIIIAPNHEPQIISETAVDIDFASARYTADTRPTESVHVSLSYMRLEDYKERPHSQATLEDARLYLCRECSIRQQKWTITSYCHVRSWSQRQQSNTQS